MSDNTRPGSCPKQDREEESRISVRVKCLTSWGIRIQRSFGWLQTLDWKYFKAGGWTNGGGRLVWTHLKQLEDSEKQLLCWKGRICGHSPSTLLHLNCVPVSCSLWLWLLDQNKACYKDCAFSFRGIKCVLSVTKAQQPQSNDVTSLLCLWQNSEGKFREGERF